MPGTEVFLTTMLVIAFAGVVVCAATLLAILWSPRGPWLPRALVTDRRRRPRASVDVTGAGAA